MLIESDTSGAFVALRGNPEHGYSRGHLCGKTAIYGDLVNSPDRLLTPLVRRGSKRNGELVPATWEEALARIVERVGPLKTHGEQILVAFYAGTMGRIQRFFPLRMFHALGATLTDGGLCDNSTTAGYECVLGNVVGADLERADESDAVVLWGCDMVRTVQHLQPAVQKLCKRGVPAVAIDIYRSDTIAALEKWGGRGLIVKPGTDAALALGLARIAFEREWVDRAFLDSECLGAREFEAHVRSGHDLASTSAITGLAESEILELAEPLARSPKLLLKTGVGFGRRRNGAMSMRAVCSLAAVLGKVDNLHYESFSCFQLADDVVQRPDLRAAGRPNPTFQHAKLGRELESGRYKALFVWAHNPAVVCPESMRVRAGMQRDDVFVVVHEQFLTESAQLADVVLPSTMFVEHTDVYRSYGHRRLQVARKACEPPAGPRSVLDTFAAIAKALDLPRETWDVTSETLLEAFLESTLALMGDAQRDELLAGKPIKVSRALKPGEGTPSGKVELMSSAAAALGQPALATYVPDDGCGTRGEFWLVSAPSVHTHNSTFSHSGRHVRRVGEQRVKVNPSDAQRLGLVDGARATLSNAHGSVTFPVDVTSDMPPGLVRIDGLPRAEDTPERVGVNALVSAEVSDLGDNNSLYSTRVDLRRA